MNVLSSCRTDLSARISAPLFPLCLNVSSTPGSWQRDHVFIAAVETNEDIGFDAFHVHPDCSPGDTPVAFSFVHELPDDCSSLTGCTFFRWIVNGKPSFVETVIQADAPFRTVQHEIWHLAGCRHLDGPPCW